MRRRADVEEVVPLRSATRRDRDVATWVRAPQVHLGEGTMLVGLADGQEERLAVSR
jgi:hypothetical protein